jgi:LmbE family N-acetylglucosaminyl deacetylase
VNIVILSPHLDDGALSLGGTMSRMVHEGHRVKMVTVFAGNPERNGPPSLWDRGRGLKSSSEAVLQRREEDRCAADVLGVEPVWLPFEDDAYLVRRDPDEIWEAISPNLCGAARVFVPGWPVSHHDHRYVTSLMLSRCSASTSIRLYAELPYSNHPVPFVKGLLSRRADPSIADALPNGLRWSRSPFGQSDLAAKIRAVACYSGEISALGWRLPLPRRLRFQLAFEHIGRS